MVKGKFEGFEVDAKGCMVSATGGVYAALDGLYEDWDGQKRLREQMRDVNRLLVGKPREGEKVQTTSGAIARTALNLRFNHLAVEPLAKKMKAAPNSVPCIEKLHKEVLKLYEAHGYNPSFKEVQDEAWSLRYMFGLLKQLTYKASPPKDPCYIQYFIFYPQGSWLKKIGCNLSQFVNLVLRILSFFACWQPLVSMLMLGALSVSRLLQPRTAG